MDLVASETGR